MIINISMGLSVLLTVLALCCFTSSVFTAEVNHVTHVDTLLPKPIKAPIKLPALPPLKAPIKLPTMPPVKAPIKVPTIRPIKPPVLPPVTPQVSKTLAAVRGFVYCQSCKYGVNTRIGAMPIQDAVVRVVCNEMSKVIAEAKTGKNGSFLFFIPKKTIATWTKNACKVILVKSPDVKCSKVPKFDIGNMGSVLKPGKSTIAFKQITYVIYKATSFFLKRACPK